MRSSIFVQAENCSNRILLRDPLAIAAGGYVLNPVLMLQIPLNGLADSSLKRFLRAPVQFALDFTRVHGIAAVMTGAILDECNQAAMGHDGVMRTQFVEQFADGVYDFEIF